MSSLSLFWSYAHIDEKGDRGRVTMLAEHLADEIRMISGKELELFLDRDSIEWGDEWRKKIDDSLASSTFLVAVMTPSYFQRAECRKEFVGFYRQAESRDLDKLMLPLAYSSIEDFNSENPDQAISIAARYQYEDWTRLRLKSPDSEEYRHAVNRLARRVMALHQQMSELEVQQAAKATAEPEAAEVDFLAAVAEIDERLPKWLDAVETHIVRSSEREAMLETYIERMRKVPEGRRLAVRHRFAADEVDHVTRTMYLAKEYSALAIEMAPYVTSVLRTARGSEVAREALRPLFDALAEAHRQILWAYGTPGVRPSAYWDDWAHLGGVFVRAADAHREFDAFVAEGNDLVEGWFVELSAILGEEAVR